MPARCQQPALRPQTVPHSPRARPLLQPGRGSLELNHTVLEDPRAWHPAPRSASPTGVAPAAALGRTAPGKSNINRAAHFQAAEAALGEAAPWCKGHAWWFGSWALLAVLTKGPRYRVALEEHVVSTWRKVGHCWLCQEGPQSTAAQMEAGGQRKPSARIPWDCPPGTAGDALHQLPPAAIPPRLVIIPVGICREAGTGASLPWGGSTPSREHRAEDALKHALAMGWGRASQLEAQPAPSLPAYFGARE